MDTKTLLKYAGRILFYISQLNEFQEVAAAFMNKIGTYEHELKQRDTILAILQHCYGVGTALRMDPLVVAKSI